MQNLTDKKMKSVLCFVLFFSYYAFAQQEIKMTVDEYNKEKETILNTIINSVQFDSINSIYSDSSLHFVFAKNEVFYSETRDEYAPITLMYRNQKVKIVDCSQTEENCWWVSDFFLNVYIKNPKEARVMMGPIQRNENVEDVSIGIILEKRKKWQIKNFTLID